jgi:hypothetical protein
VKRHHCKPWVRARKSRAEADSPWRFQGKGDRKRVRSPFNATWCGSAEPGPASRIWPSPLPGPVSVTARATDSSMWSIWSTGLRPRAGPDARGYSHLRARTAAEGLKSARQSPSSVNIAPAPESFSLISADRRRFAGVCAGASPLWDDLVECPSLHRAFSSPMVARISERSMVPTITLIPLVLLENDGMDEVAASSYDPTTACSSATTYNRSRIAYDNRSHPVVRRLLFIGRGYEREALAGPPQLHPVF